MSLSDLKGRGMMLIRLEANGESDIQRTQVRRGNLKPPAHTNTENGGDILWQPNLSNLKYLHIHIK